MFETTDEENRIFMQDAFVFFKTLNWKFDPSITYDDLLKKSELMWFPNECKHLFDEYIMSMKNPSQQYHDLHPLGKRFVFIHFQKRIKMFVRKSALAMNSLEVYNKGFIDMEFVKFLIENINLAILISSENDPIIKPVETEYLSYNQMNTFLLNL
jgi:hypothetical protein